jgi:hypothetical protein
MLRVRAVQEEAFKPAKAKIESLVSAGKYHGTTYLLMLYVVQFYKY